MGAGRGLKTLDRSLYILTLFDAEHRSWGVTGLARHLELPKSVVQKTWATFARRGFLYQEHVSRRYRLGPRILSLARLAGPELAHLARPQYDPAHRGNTRNREIEPGVAAITVPVYGDGDGQTVTERGGAIPSTMG